MRTRPTVLYYSPAGRSVPEFVTQWVDGTGLTVVPLADAATVEEMVLRMLPSLVIVDADSAGGGGLELCVRLKADPYTGIVPLVVV